MRCAYLRYAADAAMSRRRAAADAFAARHAARRPIERRRAHERPPTRIERAVAMAFRMIAVRSNFPPSVRVGRALRSVRKLRRAMEKSMRRRKLMLISTFIVIITRFGYGSRQW